MPGEGESVAYEKEESMGGEMKSEAKAEKLSKLCKSRRESRSDLSISLDEEGER